MVLARWSVSVFWWCGSVYMATTIMWLCWKSKNKNVHVDIHMWIRLQIVLSMHDGCMVGAVYSTSEEIQIREKKATHTKTSYWMGSSIYRQYIIIGNVVKIHRPPVPQCTNPGTHKNVSAIGIFILKTKTKTKNWFALTTKTIFEWISPQCA